MIWLSEKIATYDGDDAVIKSHLLSIIKWFWSFSRFYGIYTSMPIQHRRNFVSDFEKQAEK
ncbi:MAG TPA: hypothetical protein ACFE0H_09255 [Elainellaceae cyanobacterium]